MKKILPFIFCCCAYFGIAQVDFTMTPTSGCVTLDVTFAFNGNPSGISDLYFDLGSGDELFGALNDQFNFTFASVGTRTIIMYALSADGDIIGFSSKTLELTGASVSASIAVAGLGENVEFKSEGDATSVTWNFGDGFTAQGTKATHAYTNPGTYEIEATIVSESCGTSTQLLTVEVLDFDFNFDPKTGCAPEVVNFSFSGNDANVAYYFWDFGDGATDFFSGANINHTYSSSGTYQVTLMLFDGLFTYLGELTKEIKIIGVGFDASYLITTVDQQIDFTSYGTDGTNLNWAFGDGSSSTEVNPSHTYASEGSYTVSLTAESVCGTQNVTREIIIVDITLDAAVPSGCTMPSAVDFSLTTDLTAAYYFWDFGDDSTIFDEFNVASHTYTQDGKYLVVVTLYNDFFEEIGTVTKEINLGVSIEVSNPYLKIGQSTSFMVNGQHNTVTWDFGDGVTSSDLTPVHSYAASGTYEVTATIETTDCGTLTKNLTIEVRDISYQVTNQGGCLPVSVDFTYTGTDTEVVFFEWFYGDGNESFGPNTSITHQYTNAGNYMIFVAAYNLAFELLGYDTLYVNVQGGTAPFQLSYNGNLSLCEGESIDLTAPSLANLEWSTGETTNTITVNTPGKYWAFINGGTCGVSSDTLDIVIHTLPIVHAGVDTTICLGDSLTLNGEGALTYVWNNGIIDGEKFAPMDTTTYTVVGTDMNMCTNTDQVIVNVSVCASIEEQEKYNYNLYPNPSTGLVKLNVTNEVKGLRLINMMGQEVFQQEINKYELNLEGLENGCYLVQFIGQRGTVIHIERLQIMK